MALRLGVDGRHRVVQDEDARAGDERPRERDALALTAGEIDAALADQRVVAVGQVRDEPCDARGLARVEHLAPVRVRPGGQEVVAERDREQDRLLRHDRDRGAELGERQVASVDASEEDAPGVGS